MEKTFDWSAHCHAMADFGQVLSRGFLGHNTFDH